MNSDAAAVPQRSSGGGGLGEEGTGRAASNAVPFIRPRGKTGAAQGGGDSQDT